MKTNKLKSINSVDDIPSEFVSQIWNSALDEAINICCKYQKELEIIRNKIVNGQGNLYENFVNCSFYSTSKCAGEIDNLKLKENK